MSTKDWSELIEAAMGHETPSSLNLPIHITMDEAVQLLRAATSRRRKGGAPPRQCIAVSPDPSGGYVVWLKPQKGAEA